MAESHETHLIPRPIETHQLARGQDYVPLDVPYWEEDPGVDWRGYWRTIKKRRWAILAVLFLALALGTIYSFKAQSIYQAKARVQIDKDSPNIVAYRDFVNDNPDNEQVAVATQVEVLGGETLAYRVLRQLDLTHHPLFSPDPKPSLLQKLYQRVAQFASLKTETVKDPGEEKKEAQVVDQYMKDLEVTPIRGSRIIEIAYSSPDPRLAARVANAIIATYIELNMESHYQTTLNASDWLMKQSLDLKAKVEKSEAALVDYARANQIMPTEEKQNIVIQKLTDLNEELTKAQSDRITKESLYRQIHSGEGTDLNLIRENSFIKALSERQVALAQQYADLAARFGTNWPSVQQVKSQIEELKTEIATETERILKGIDADYFTAVKREQLLQNALDRQKGEANLYREKSIQYNILKREVDSNKQLYDGLLQRLKEASISAGLKSSNIRVVDLAVVPQDPISPKKAKNILISLLVGLFLGVGLAFVLEYVDTSLNTPDEIARVLRLPSLAMVPALTNGRRNRSLVSSNGRLLTAPPTIDLICQTHVGSLVSEAYRDLRTSILFSFNGRPPKSILVTSPGPREGKTATAANLAVSLTQLGKRVLLMDADMRRPRLHKVFDIPRHTEGLSSLLSGGSKLIPLIVETRIPDLFVIPAGRTPSNPSELLSSEVMRKSLDLLAEQFDHIILDSPPVLSATDAKILSTMVEGVVLVVQGGSTDGEAAIRAIQRLRDVGARILGTVINNVDVRSADYDSYYYQYYYEYHPSEKGEDSGNGHREQ